MSYARKTLSKLADYISFHGNLDEYVAEKVGDYDQTFMDIARAISNSEDPRDAESLKVLEDLMTTAVLVERNKI